MISWPAAKQIRWVKPSMATVSPSRTSAATASRIDVTLDSATRCSGPELVDGPLVLVEAPGLGDPAVPHVIHARRSPFGSLALAFPSHGEERHRMLVVGHDGVHVHVHRAPRRLVAALEQLEHVLLAAVGAAELVGARDVEHDVVG